MEDALVIMCAVIGSILVMVISCVGGNLIISICCHQEHSSSQDEEYDHDYSVIEDKHIHLTGIHTGHHHQMVKSSRQETTPSFTSRNSSHPQQNLSNSGNQHQNHSLIDTEPIANLLEENYISPIPSRGIHNPLMSSRHSANSSFHQRPMTWACQSPTDTHPTASAPILQSSPSEQQ